MNINVINIGNSKGIRLSKTILDKYKITDSVEVVLEKNQIVLKPIKEPRKNWEQAFLTMNKKGEDQLLIDDIFIDETFEI